MRVPVVYFPVVDGLMTSEDGKQFFFMCGAKTDRKRCWVLPHAELPSLVTCAAMQMDKGCGKRDGDKLVTAFSTSGFQIGRRRR